jgi:hypothetical protein
MLTYDQEGTLKPGLGFANILDEAAQRKPYGKSCRQILAR